MRYREGNLVSRFVVVQSVDVQPGHAHAHAVQAHGRLDREAGAPIESIAFILDGVA